MRTVLFSPSAATRSLSRAWTPIPSPSISGQYLPLVQTKTCRAQIWSVASSLVSSFATASRSSLIVAIYSWCSLLRRHAIHDDAMMRPLTFQRILQQVAQIADAVFLGDLPRDLPRSRPIPLLTQELVEQR